MVMTNIMAMMETANDKYAKLIDSMYQIKAGSEVDFDKVIKLIHSVYNDEVELITKLNEIEQPKYEKKPEQRELQVVTFVCR